MGQHKSKHSKTSYDIPPVVSEQDLRFKNNQHNAEKQDETPQNRLSTTSIDNEAIDIKTESHEIKATAASNEEPKTNAPVFQCPEWVKESLFTDVLKQHFKDFKAIKDFKTSAATSGGDNYSSTMIKVDIDSELENSETKNSSYMLKVALDNEQSNAMVEAMGTYKKEIAMYNEYISEFEDLYKKVDVDVVFAPKSFSLPEQPFENVIILENMRPAGYKNADRLAGLNEIHTQAVLKKLAQFHAASACYAVDHEFPQVVKRSIFCEELRPFFREMKELFTSLFLECVQTYDHQQEYIDKVKKMIEVYIDVMIETAKVDENGFNVLNHGDVWTNNILFKYDENGKIESTYLIDYQMVNYGSPAFDLYYFLMSSPTLDIKVKKFDCHIKFYHDQLVENLKLLKYPKHIPALKELHCDLIKRGAFGFSTTLGVMAAVLLDPTEMANMENMLSNEDVGLNLRRQMYGNKRYRKHGDTILLWLKDRGLFLFAK